MRARLSLFVCLLSLFATSLFGKDVYLSIGGSANGFFTDARIVNPSFTKDITITARYLPAGNVDNSGVATKTITVAKRSMAVYDDVVKVLFPGAPALGAIRLTSDDDFIATQRIYADKRTDRQQGTLGQFVQGLEATAARRKGVISQLKSGQAALGNFRTNLGGANPNGVVATVNFTLYDRNNTVAGTNTLTFQPFGVFSPANITGFFGQNNPDILSDAWISYESDQPVFIYGSVVDNGSEDPTFIPASEDTGVAPPAEPQMKTVNVTAQNWFFVVNASAPLRPGDQVRFIIRSGEGDHGFTLFTPGGQVLINEPFFGSQELERVVTLPTSGTYSYFCAFNNCGIGHSSMNGAFTVDNN